MVVNKVLAPSAHIVANLAIWRSIATKSMVDQLLLLGVLPLESLLITWSHLRNSFVMSIMPHGLAIVPSST